VLKLEKLDANVRRVANSRGVRKRQQLSKISISIVNKFLPIYITRCGLNLDSWCAQLFLYVHTVARGEKGMLLKGRKGLGIASVEVEALALGNA